MFCSRELAARLIGCWWLLAAMLALSACQAPPQPFAPTSKAPPSREALLLSPRLGLLVEPLRGPVEPELRDRFRALMVEALRRHDFTAGTAQGHRGSAVLSGRFDGGGAIDWRIHGANGGLLVEIRQTLARDDRFDTGDPDALAELAGRSATLLDQALLQQEQGDERRIRLAPVSLGPIDGAPGNGASSLRAELGRAMRDAGISSPPDDDDALVLIGSVHQGRTLGAQREVEIVWQVIRPDGTEIGRVSQRNLAPVTQLDGAWGRLARDIAAAAIGGIVDLLRRIEGPRSS